MNNMRKTWISSNWIVAVDVWMCIRIGVWRYVLNITVPSHSHSHNNTVFHTFILYGACVCFDFICLQKFTPFSVTCTLCRCPLCFVTLLSSIVWVIEIRLITCQNLITIYNQWNSWNDFHLLFTSWIAHKIPRLAIQSYGVIHPWICYTVWSFASEIIFDEIKSKDAIERISTWFEFWIMQNAKCTLF